MEDGSEKGSPACSIRVIRAIRGLQVLEFSAAADRRLLHIIDFDERGAGSAILSRQNGGEKTRRQGHKDP